MNEIIVVDANGNRLNPNPKHLVKPKWRTLKLQARARALFSPPSPTTSDLERLEDAIWQHPDLRIEFLNIYKSKNSYPDTEKQYLEKHHSRKMTALRYCWNIKKWKPSADGNRVIVGNPYWSIGKGTQPGGDTKPIQTARSL